MRAGLPSAALGDGGDGFQLAAQRRVKLGPVNQRGEHLRSRLRRVRASCCGSRGSAVTFAALCGVSPVEASSGKTQRRRLNRGGARQANCALYTIVLARLRWDARTRAYLERRVTEGKPRREA